MQLVPDTVTLGVKQPGQEADHSPPYSAVDLCPHSLIMWEVVQIDDEEESISLCIK